MSAKRAASARVVRRPANRGGDASSGSDGYSDEDSGTEAGGSAAVQWVCCDKCGRWRKLSGLTDLKSLPKRWFCKMNPDPKYNDCSIAEEEEEDPDQKLRAHLRLWARRLRGAEDADVRLPFSTSAHGTRGGARRHKGVGEQEWVQCGDPSCGKWRALHRSMDAATLAAAGGEWYCVLNTWDEALASCAAPQELPSDVARDRALAAASHDDTPEDPRGRKAARR